MGKIGKHKAKLALITLGSAIVVGAPIIIVGSIYAFNEISVSPELERLTKFYDQEAGSLFSPINFTISQPIPSPEGKFLVENVTTDNIQFLKMENLNNSLYGLEITSIIPNVEEATLNFRYKVFLISDPSVNITKESEKYYGFFDIFQKFQFFSK
ncbi:MAG: hypothetical protein ACRDCJ_01730 [Metamycoplasmataceae bacterium]